MAPSKQATGPGLPARAVEQKLDRRAPSGDGRGEPPFLHRPELRRDEIGRALDETAPCVSINLHEPTQSVKSQAASEGPEAQAGFPNISTLPKQASSGKSLPRPKDFSLGHLVAAAPSAFARLSSEIHAAAATVASIRRAERVFLAEIERSAALMVPRPSAEILAEEIIRACRLDDLLLELETGEVEPHDLFECLCNLISFGGFPPRDAALVALAEFGVRPAKPPFGRILPSQVSESALRRLAAAYDFHAYPASRLLGCDHKTLEKHFGQFRQVIPALLATPRADESR